MKKLQKQAIFPVLMLLVVTALALVGSSLAWFSMANSASVSAVNGQVESGGVGLMISQDATTFVSNVTLNSDAATYVVPGRFHQVSTINAVNFFEATITQKAADGTAQQIFTTADASVISANGIVKGKANASDATGVTSGTTSIASYMVFDLFFQADVAADLYLNYGTSFSAANGAEAAMKVAFLSMGNAANASAVIALTGVSKTTIWSPADETSYFGVKAASTSANPFAPYAVNASYAESVTTLASASLFNGSQTFNEDSVMTGYTSLASLSAGLNKLRVVVWLEGNDPDCVAGIASDTFSLSLAFFAKASA